MPAKWDDPWWDAVDEPTGEDAGAAGVPELHVAHGPTLAGWLRDVPYLEQVYLGAAASAFSPA